MSTKNGSASTQVSQSSKTFPKSAELEADEKDIQLHTLLEENNRLREIERKWNELAKFCPSLDIRIHTDPDVDVQSENPTKEIIKKWTYNLDGT